MTQAERIAMNVWNDVIARPRNQHKGISYAQLEKVVQSAMDLNLNRNVKLKTKKMILRKKLMPSEKTLISNTDQNNYTIRYCSDHGVFANRNDVDSGECPFCQKVCEMIENISELIA